MSPGNFLLTTEVVPFDDGRAVELRGALSTELLARYATKEFPRLSSVSRAALDVPPEQILATVLVLNPEGTALGHASLRRLGDEFEVKRVIVLPEARGKGAATVLMSAVERLAVEAGASRLILQTGDKQPEAVELYRKLGYTPIPIYPPYDTAIPFSSCFAKTLRS
ncbi:acetyltransferase [Pseudarthrobacter phenanthrenivorans Sphe3]|uniref:Acetyltransferase n=1 Tax=Pseudarthrobacter phenanthrenivorans (strain DSM 18606 / JCM 16027 / LMG 23796 / Sphe3) TaxID=930171 RepID=F0MB15_PSEPM|nr:GNAT family N-acetyltransferase [Pseudarthrobacter phenanthrenivorans]ADX72891.1 acetyltransferase [Pseudarthrobacter phenanthrenivorans Sphe3]